MALSIEALMAAPVVLDHERNTRMGAAVSFNAELARAEDGPQPDEPCMCPGCDVGLTDHANTPQSFIDALADDSLPF